MASDYTLSYLIVCDDIRSEKSGKDILIGVYSDYIVVPSLPAFLPFLSFRVSVRLKRSNFERFDFQLKDPMGNGIITGGGPITVQVTNDLTNFNLGFSPVLLSVTGRHTIWFGIDEEPKEIGAITVRLPESAEEAAKIG